MERDLGHRLNRDASLVGGIVYGPRGVGVHGEEVGAELRELLAVLRDVHDVLLAVGQRELLGLDLARGPVRADDLAPRLRYGVRGELEDVRLPRIDHLLLAHEHLVIAVVRGDHVRLLGLGRPGLAGHPRTAHAPLLLRRSEDLAPELVRAAFVVAVVEPNGVALEAIEHVIVAVQVVLDGALEAEVGRLLEHLEEHLLVEIGFLVAVLLVVVVVHHDVAIFAVRGGGGFRGGFGLGRSLLRFLLLLLNLLEVRELGHDHLRGFVLLDVSDVVHRARHEVGSGGLLQGALGGPGRRAPGAATALVRHGAGVRERCEPCSYVRRETRAVCPVDRLKVPFQTSDFKLHAGIETKPRQLLRGLVIGAVSGCDYIWL